jgi:hypothetical protein
VLGRSETGHGRARGTRSPAQLGMTRRRKYDLSAAASAVDRAVTTHPPISPSATNWAVTGVRLQWATASRRKSAKDRLPGCIMRCCTHTHQTFKLHVRLDDPRARLFRSAEVLLAFTVSPERFAHYRSPASTRSNESTLLMTER